MFSMGGIGVSRLSSNASIVLGDELGSLFPGLVTLIAGSDSTRGSDRDMLI